MVLNSAAPEIHHLGVQKGKIVAGFRGDVGPAIIACLAACQVLCKPDESLLHSNFLGPPIWPLGISQPHN